MEEERQKRKRAFSKRTALLTFSLVRCLDHFFLRPLPPAAAARAFCSLEVGCAFPGCGMRVAHNVA